MPSRVIIHHRIPCSISGAECSMTTRKSGTTTNRGFATVEMKAASRVSGSVLTNISFSVERDSVAVSFVDNLAKILS
jgi:hypothetical protein